MKNQTFNHPTVSIVIPLYNKEHEVVRAINSVLSQTFTNFEVIIVNDGSTDKGPVIVRSIGDPRVRIIDQQNAGVSGARNRGIAEVRAELIAFLDADDEWEPDFLETIIRLRDRFPSCDIFATNYSFRRADNYKRATIIRGLPDKFDEGILPNYFEVASQSDPPLCSSAIAVTRSAIESIGGFPIGVVAGEDLLTWARLAVKYDIAYSFEPKAHFWEPLAVSDRPGRVPNEPDVVGQELELLLERYPAGEKRESLKDYVALWHRMRSSIFIRLSKRRDALREIQKAVHLSGFNGKLFLYALGILLPNRFAVSLMKFIRSKMQTIIYP